MEVYNKLTSTWNKLARRRLREISFTIQPSVSGVRVEHPPVTLLPAEGSSAWIRAMGSKEDNPPTFARKVFINAISQGTQLAFFTHAVSKS